MRISHTLAFAVMLLLNACNTIDHGDTAHNEPAGLTLALSGREAVRYHALQVTGKLTLQSGQEAGPIIVSFLDDGGDVIPTSEMEEGTSLAWTVADPAVLTARQDSADAWSFYAVGHKADTTSIVIRLLHNGHDDFLSMPIPVEVLP